MKLSDFCWSRFFWHSLSFLAMASPLFAYDFEAERLDNWHQWRGPNADGVAPKGDPPVEWSESTNIRWKKEIPGAGSSSPVIWGDRLFVLTAIKTEEPAESANAGQAKAESGETSQQQDQPPPRRGGRRGRFGGFGRFGGGEPPTNKYQFVAVCLDRRTGDVLWQRICKEELPHEGHHETNTFASASPTTDGEHVYASFGSRGIFCLDMEGNIRWQRDLGDMETRNGFGEGSSPTLHGNWLVVNWDHEGQSFIAVLDAKSGETRWQAERDELTTWATPLVIEHKGRTQVITNGSNRVRSYDLASGELIWECGGQASNPIPSPLKKDDLVYCTTGYRGNAVFAIPLDATGDITGSDRVAWHTNETGPYIASPVSYGGLLYLTKGRNAILTSLDLKTGEPVIGMERLPDLDILYASPVAADERIYFTGRDGTTLVIRHGPKLDVLATNKLDEGIDASPAIVGNQIFLRGANHVYCIGAG